MDLCYLDESGNHAPRSNTTHYVLAGISIPDTYWRGYHRSLEELKAKFGLGTSEIHTGWMLRPYPEQDSIDAFESLSSERRRLEVNRKRSARLIGLQRQSSPAYKQTKTNYAKTDAYVHLSFEERRHFVREVAGLFGGWQDARLFAECINKLHLDPQGGRDAVQEQAFEQVVSRFEQFLKNAQRGFGILIHDNNESVARRYTDLMKGYLRNGTFWTDVEHVIETPLFVDSELTDMVQLADLAAYALRRYLENGEEELFDLVFQRADRAAGFTVGVRHFTGQGCQCKICVSHG